jgi:hypothetical protein
MGGYDIYYSTWDDNKKEWGQPVNMGYPINDTYNNYNISWVENRFAYVSAIRPEGQGKYDVYKVVFNNTNPYNALVRCEIRLKKDRRIQIPDFSPLITVTDTLDNLIGTYKAKTDSADFVIALTTGYYKIKVEHDTIEPLSYDLFIPDNRFESVADRIRLIVVPKRLEAESK